MRELTRHIKVNARFKTCINDNKTLYRVIHSGSNSFISYPTKRNCGQQDACTRVDSGRLLVCSLPNNHRWCKAAARSVSPHSLRRRARADDGTEESTSSWRPAPAVIAPFPLLWGECHERYVDVSVRSRHWRVSLRRPLSVARSANTGYVTDSDW